MTWLRRRTQQRRAESRTLPRISITMTPRAVSVGRWLQGIMLSMTVSALSLTWWWWEESVALEKNAARLAAATTRTESLTGQLKAQMTRDGLTLSAEQMARIRMDVVFLNQLADKRAFSWVQLLSDLEATVPQAIAISSVKVNFQESTVSLNGVSHDLSSLNNFVTNLQKHAAFRKAALVNHHLHDDEAVQGGRGAHGATGPHTGNEIQFSLAAQYRLQTEGAE